VGSKKYTKTPPNRRARSTKRLVFDLLLADVKAVTCNLLVVLLERSKILASFGKLAFLHTFADIPVYEGALGKHEVELAVKAAPSFGNGGGIGEHADGAVDGSELALRDADGLLVALRMSEKRIKWKVNFKLT
jgi:hypothetical protein